MAFLQEDLIHNELMEDLALGILTGSFSVWYSYRKI